MQNPGTDPLSSLATKIIAAGSYRDLVVIGEKSALARELLDNVAPDQLLSAPTQNPIAAWAMLGALWLRHDALYACHEIVQKSPQKLLPAAPFLHQTPRETSLKVHSVQNVGIDNKPNSQQLRGDEISLSFWHAIMHRREGDFSNSKYWYARCAGHPALPSLAAKVSGLVNAMPAEKSLLRLVATGWNPNAFVDLVEEVHQREDDPRRKLAVALQRLEWQVLFDHCTRAAAG